MFLLVPLQRVSDQTTIKAANGKSLKALTIFSHSIKFLKDEALKVICERTGDTYFSVSDIQWVLTVPAIWTPVAKQFMREAAYEVRGAFHLRKKPGNFGGSKSGISDW